VTLTLTSTAPQKLSQRASSISFWNEAFVLEPLLALSPLLLFAATDALQKTSQVALASIPAMLQKQLREATHNFMVMH
jgi:hypothetical protein